MTDTTTPAAGGALDNWETTTPGPNTGRRTDEDLVAQVRALDGPLSARRIARELNIGQARAGVILRLAQAPPGAPDGQGQDIGQMAVVATPDATETPAPMAGHGLDAALGPTERLGGRGLPPHRRPSALDPDQRARAVALQVADDVLLAREDATVGDLLALADYIVAGTRATEGGAA